MGATFIKLKIYDPIELEDNKVDDTKLKNNTKLK